MKTERRHELETNYLADWLGKKLEAIQPYNRLITLTLVGICVAVGLYFIWSNQQASQNEQAWHQFFSKLDESLGANNTDALRDMIEQYPDAEATNWARVALGDIQLAEGVDLMFSDRASGKEQLRRAAENFQQARDRASSPELRGRATLGLGKAHESLNELKEARDQYERLVQSMPESIYGQEAQLRLNDLDRGGTKGFYDWFASQDPGGALGDEPGLPGDRPEFNLDNLPDDSIFESPLGLDGPDGPMIPLFGNPDDAPASDTPETQQDADTPANP